MLNIKFLTKKSVGAHVYLFQEWSHWGSKDWYVSNILLYWNMKVDKISGWTLRKLPIISKNSLNQSCSELISYEKDSGRTCLSPPGVEQRCSKDCYLWNIIMLWNGKVDSLEGLTLPKLTIISKNCSNKSCSELNFVQKCHWTRMSITPRSGATRLERLICFKYYIILKWKSKFTSEFNATKNKHFIKKCFK